jgi:hypothetical protein
MYRIGIKSEPNLGTGNTVEKDLAKAVIGRAFLDSVGDVGSEGAMGGESAATLKSQAKDFINSSQVMFKLWCDIADTEPNYIITLHDSLTYHYNCGKLKSFSIKTIVDRLLKKL